MNTTGHLLLIPEKPLVERKVGNNSQALATPQFKTPIALTAHENTAGAGPVEPGHLSGMALPSLSVAQRRTDVDLGFLETPRHPTAQLPHFCS